MARSPNLDQRLQRLHAQGLMNRELAAQLGVSEATVKRRKKTLGLGSNCPANGLGSWGEQLVYAEAMRRGLPARIVSSRGSPHDIDIGGLRVEVKTAGFHDGAWRFRLPALRPSFHSEGPPTFKDYVRDCDLIAFVGKGGAASGSPFLHFRAPETGLSSLTLRPDDLVPGVRDNWALLKRLLISEAA